MSTARATDRPRAIDVIRILKNGKRKLVKTGLRSRDAGRLTLILPLNLKTHDLRSSTAATC